jgi:hypothetical protein
MGGTLHRAAHVLRDTAPASAAPLPPSKSSVGSTCANHCTAPAPCLNPLHFFASTPRLTQVAEDAQGEEPGHQVAVQLALHHLGVNRLLLILRSQRGAIKQLA